MRKINAAIWCLFIHAATYAQPGFNTAHDYDNFVFSYYFDVTVSNDTIISYGLAQDTTWPYRQGVFVARSDTFGNKLDHRLILDTNNIYSIDKHWGKIIRTSNGGYAITTATLFGRDGVFIKLDNQLNTEFVQKYVDTINGGEFLVAPLEVPDGYLLYGFFNKATDNDKLDALLRKVDKQGNPIWKKTWGIPLWDDSFRDAFRYQDSLWLINGSKTFNNGFDPLTRPWFCVFNDAGDLKWQFTADNTLPFNGLGLGRFFPQPDGSWICYAGKNLGIDPVYGWNRYQANWVKLDSSFQFVWNKPFGPKVYYLDRFQDILRAPNGDLIGIGERGPYFIDNTYYRKGWIMRFNPEGDSLWDWVGKAPIVNPGPHFFSGGDMLSSGSIVAAGSGQYPTGFSFSWLVKISPEGCVDTFFCHPAVSPVVEMKEEAVEIQVFPNPASEQVRVLMKHPDFTGGQLELFDSTGRFLLRRMIQSREEILSLYHLSPGLYQIRCVTKDMRKTALSNLVIIP